MSLPVYMLYYHQLFVLQCRSWLSNLTEGTLTLKNEAKEAPSEESLPLEALKMVAVVYW